MIKPKKPKLFPWWFVILFIVIPVILVIPLVEILSHEFRDSGTVEDGVLWGLAFLAAPFLAVYTVIGWIVKLLHYNVSVSDNKNYERYDKSIADDVPSTIPPINKLRLYLIISAVTIVWIVVQIWGQEIFIWLIGQS